MKKFLFFIAICTSSVQLMFAQAITGTALYSTSGGGARILKAQGNTPANPAIGFQSTTLGGNDGGGGCGIFRPLANTIAFATMSTEQMRIDPGGHIGIGTTVITNTAGWNKVVELYGPNHSAFCSKSNSIQTFLGSDNIHGSLNGGFIGTQTNHNLYFVTNYNEKGVITTSGNWGINTLTPSAKLHVNGSARLEGFTTLNTNTKILSGDANGNLAWRDASTLGTTYTAGSGIAMNNGIIENTGDLSSTNEIQDLSLVGNDLVLSNDATSVDLSPYMDNTDAQALTLTGNTLGISGNTNTVDLTTYLDNTDNQNLFISGNILSLTNGGSVVLPAAPVYTAGTGIDITGNVISNTIPSYFTANGTHISNNNTGNLGIGTSAPTNKVEINSGVVNTSGLTLTNLKSTSPASATNGRVLTVDATGKVILATDNVGTDWGRAGNSGTNPASNFIGTIDAKDFIMRTTNLERVRILANGNVGIGTNAPTAQLHTTGSVRFQGLANNNTHNQILVTDATGNLAWRDASTLGSNYTAGTGITITNNVISSNLISSQWSPSSPITNVTANSNIITYDGRIAVGELCTSAGFNKYPANYSGYFGNAGILASGLRIANICDPFNWADFVFEKDYHLPSLKSEKEYIEKNGHLRDVPSAKEIAEKGIDVAEMFKVQMQKIEELTLHTIALSEKVEKLQAENEALKVKLAK